MLFDFFVSVIALNYLGEFQKAKIIYDRALELNLNSSAIYKNRGKNCNIFRDFSQNLGEFKEVIVIYE